MGGEDREESRRRRRNSCKELGAIHKVKGVIETFRGGKMSLFSGGHVKSGVLARKTCPTF